MSNSLTKREKEIYYYLLKGLSYIEISKELKIANPTVVAHIASIYMKCLVGSRAELMAKRIEELETEIKNMRRTRNTGAKKA